MPILVVWGHGRDFPGYLELGTASYMYLRGARTSHSSDEQKAEVSALLISVTRQLLVLA